MITALGAVFRFYNLAWGAPYYHFHIDEHFVFTGADLLRRNPDEAALSPKFFMYSPLPMYLVNLARTVYETVAGKLVLTVPRDEVIYMVLGRGISAALGTATIPVVYAIAARLAGRTAGLIAALLLACSVLHLRDSHFLTVDIAMTFFATLTLLALVLTVERGDTRSDVGTGLAFGGALLCKYAAAFLVPVIALAHLLSPRRPQGLHAGAWVRWALRGVAVGVLAVVTFLVLNPLIFVHFNKFVDDVRTWVADPLLGVSQPIWIAQFADTRPQLLWFTNLLWWGVGPALEVWGLLGLVWLVVRRDRPGLLVVSAPIVYYLIAGRTIAPFVRYALPVIPVLAVGAGVLSGDWLRRSRGRVLAGLATAGVIAATTLYAFAYMNVFRQPDARVTAARYIVRTIPPNGKVLVEPSQNIPPMGSYLTATDFYADYVMWGAQTQKTDYYRFYTLDTYVFLYDRRRSDQDKRAYIASRLAQADWIVMDDTFVQFYQHLPASGYGVMKQYYDDLFAGRLGFQLDRTFKVYPSLFGWALNDDGAELTFRLFDHPRVFVFRRASS